MMSRSTKKICYAITIVSQIMVLTSCFGVGLRMAKEAQLRDPDGYERERREIRKRHEKMAEEEGVELPPYRPNEL